MLKQLYALLVVGKEKACAAAFVALVSTFVVKHGFSLDPSFKDALEVLIVALLSHQAVYWTSNTKLKKR